MIAAGHDVRRSLRAELEDAVHIEPPLHPAKPASARPPVSARTRRIVGDRRLLPQQDVLTRVLFALF